MAQDSWASSPGVRKSMIGNKGRDTKPELAVRRLLHAQGLRYRVNVRPLPEVRRTGDVVFTKKRLVVFIDGCFWHGCPEHYTAPRSSTEYWGAKVRDNMERDADTNARLRAAGWVVLRFWEHEDPSAVSAAVVAAVA
ncbi:DNA mismatch endonuclease Vsr [Aeromicrobium sp. SMF47]|uniref:very short patch repair endonuclease n=1 Tax=Aeromicrobium yanjiei TaxID=2662028 RepID=UPI00129E7760|nr:very short patch repair endonuclease [Aeromicrobium yanjiei]MRJ75460.1 DNA mismatch endonuclease Vsr [Aeromicrobium yanjiei]